MSLPYWDCSLSKNEKSASSQSSVGWTSNSPQPRSVLPGVPPDGSASPSKGISKGSGNDGRMTGASRESANAEGVVVRSGSEQVAKDVCCFCDVSGFISIPVATTLCRLLETRPSQSSMNELKSICNFAIEVESSTRPSSPPVTHLSV